MTFWWTCIDDLDHFHPFILFYIFVLTLLPWLIQIAGIYFWLWENEWELHDQIVTQVLLFSSEILNIILLVWAKLNGHESWHIWISKSKILEALVFEMNCMLETKVFILSVETWTLVPVVIFLHSN